MCVEDYCVVVWNFVEFFDEDCVVLFQVVDYEVVVYYFMVDVDGCVQCFDCVFDDFDCMIDIGIEIMWVGEQYIYQFNFLVVVGLWFWVGIICFFGGFVVEQVKQGDVDGIYYDG